MKLLFSLLTLMLLVACGQQAGDTATANPTTDGVAAQTVAPRTDVTVQQLDSILKAGPDVFLLDVRTPHENRAGHLAGTDDQISFDNLTPNLDRLPPDKAAEIYIYCRSGRRSNIAAELLQTAGFTNVHNVEGGIIAWQSAGFPVQVGN